MSEQRTIEQRLAELETAVREIRQSLLRLPRTPDANWLDKVIGSMKDEPAFLEVVEYGRAFRQADRPSDDPNWWKIIGTVSDLEAFEEALEYGRAYRNADRPPDEPGEGP